MKTDVYHRVLGKHRVVGWQENFGKNSWKRKGETQKEETSGNFHTNYNSSEGLKIIKIALANNLD